jgi:ribonuclease HI
MHKKVIIYTDGACSGNPGLGGWGGVIICGTNEKHICGVEENTTNNRMELLAAINSLKALEEQCNVDLYSDSLYLKNGITKWIHNWKRNGWLSANKTPIKNRDLWCDLDLVAGLHNVSWYWVKGHAQNPYNIIADRLAVGAIKTRGIND